MLTLAVNVAVMAVALYAVLALHDVDGRRPSCARRGRRRRSTRGCSIAVVLIFVELMLVTAIALFFSTFSSPILSAALTFGLYVVGHFNADLRNFEQVVESRPAAWLARGLYYVLPEPRGVRRQDRRSSTGSRCRRLRGATIALRRRSTSRRSCSPRRVDLLAAGLQVTARRTAAPS